MPRAPQSKPQRPNAVIFRYIRQMLLLLAVLGVGAFYWFINSAEERQPQVLEKIGTALGIARSAPPAASVPPVESVGPVDPAGAAPYFGAAGTAGTAAFAPQDGRPSAALEPERSGGDAAARRPAAVSDFTGQELNDIVAVLSRRYAGRMPQAWGEHLPGVTSRLFADPGVADGNADVQQPLVLALTFDACGGGKGSGYDEGLIEFLREWRIPATLFFTSRWMRSNPEITRQLAADPLFEIAAHGSRHRPCSVNGREVYGIKGTANMGELVAETEGNARDIERFTGRRPLFFRSGTAYYDDVAVDAIHDLGMGIAGYSIAGDEGATLSSGRVAAKTLTAKNGDILLFHMNRPDSGTRDGLKQALPVLLERGAQFVRLSDRL